MHQETMTLRLDGKEREAFVQLCAARGVTPSEALRELVRSAISRNALPVGQIPWFEVPETKAALKEIETGGGKTFTSAKALMKDLYGDD